MFPGLDRPTSPEAKPEAQSTTLRALTHRSSTARQCSWPTTQYQHTTGSAA